jgi:hypothetical protein
MSLLGKVLAFLNILGVVGLVSLAIMCWGKREAGARGLFLSEVVLNGLPLTEDEKTPKDKYAFELLGDKMLAELFEDASEPDRPVKSVAAEVEHVCKHFKDKAKEQKAGRERQLYHTRVLLPMTKGSAGREELLACRTHLGSERSEALLKALYHEAHNEARLPADQAVEALIKAEGPFDTKDDEKLDTEKRLRAAALKQKLFEPAFRAALRDEQVQGRVIALVMAELEKKGALPQPGEEREALRKALQEQACQPCDPLAAGFLTAYPGVQGDFEKAYAKGREDWRARTEKRFNDLFDSPVLQVERKPRNPKAPEEGELLVFHMRSPAAQRHAAAALLLGVAEIQAEDALRAAKSSADSTKLKAAKERSGREYQQRLYGTAAYKKAFNRARVVVGLRSAVEAASERVTHFSDLEAEVRRMAMEEQMAFVHEHGLLLTQIEAHIAQLAADAALIEREKQLLGGRTTVLDRRKTEIEDYGKDLLLAQQETKKVSDDVRQKAQALYEARLSLRRLQDANKRDVDLLQKRVARLKQLSDESARRSAEGREEP